MSEANGLFTRLCVRNVIRKFVRLRGQSERKGPRAPEAKPGCEIIPKNHVNYP